MNASLRIDHPVYTDAGRLRGYNYPVSVFSAVSACDAAKLIRRRMPELTRDDHARLAGFHQARADKAAACWNRLLDRAAIKTFGRPFRFADYRISGIGREEFSDHDKSLLRRAVKAKSRHRVLARAHQHVARYMRKTC